MWVKDTRLVVAVSSRALFSLEESHEVYVSEGVDAYCRYQIERENELLEPGVAFPMVKKLLGLNGKKPDAPVVEVILLSRNSADTGLRIFNSIQHYGLDISRAVFGSGRSPYAYAKPFGAHLFLSADSDDVRDALGVGLASATILPSASGDSENNDVRIAFDGDAVLFSDEAERVFKEEGLAAFMAHEQGAAKTALTGGPFKDVLSALHRIQQAYPQDQSPIRTALVTARAAPTHERVIRTLREWGVRIDEALFLGGMPKGEFLKVFGADIFFDDQQVHCETARAHVPTGHVPHGVANGG